MKRSLTILFLIGVTAVLLVVASIGASSGARAQTGHIVYLPLIEYDCVGCDPKPTPTPRMWTHWDELE